MHVLEHSGCHKSFDGRWSLFWRQISGGNALEQVFPLRRKGFYNSLLPMTEMDTWDMGYMGMKMGEKIKTVY